MTRKKKYNEWVKRLEEYENSGSLSFNDQLRYIELIRRDCGLFWGLTLKQQKLLYEKLGQIMDKMHSERINSLMRQMYPDVKIGDPYP